MTTTATPPTTRSPERRTMLFRLVPVELWNARRPHRMLERHWVLNKAGGWLIVVTGVLEPLFFLLSVRIGFAALVGDVTDGGRTVPYADFVAPALMAAAAMNGAVFESTMNIFSQLKQYKVFDAALATPITAGDVALGEVMYATIRGALYSLAFIVTLLALGMVSTPWMLLSVPICVLMAFAFAAVGLSVTTFMRSYADFEYVPTVLLPMFLFSATFYPLESYGDWAWMVNVSPLYHGVALVRGVSYGEFHWSYLGHLAVLVSMAVVGLVVATRRIRNLVLQ